MSVKPMLGDWEVPRVSALQTLEQRGLSGVPIPGLPAGVFQKLQAKPTRVFIAGSIFGEDDRNEFSDSIREKYIAGEPITFVSDILNGTDVQYVVIESLNIEMNAQRPDQIEYSIILAQSPPPPPPAGLFDSIDTSLLDQAGDFLDSVTGALDALDALGSIPDIGDPTTALTGALDEVNNAVDSINDVASSLTGLFGN